MEFYFFWISHRLPVFLYKQRQQNLKLSYLHVPQMKASVFAGSTSLQEQQLWSTCLGSSVTVAPSAAFLVPKHVIVHSTKQKIKLICTEYVVS